MQPRGAEALVQGVQAQARDAPIEDGADRDVLRDRVTHTKPRRDAFDGYDRGAHWLETCAEIAKLRISRRPSRGVLVAINAIK
jgi:hypothetical protein